MDGIAKDAISLLQYLLPGFLAAWVFFGLTSYPVPSQFERVVQALIFTLIVQAIVFLERAGLLWIGGRVRLGVWTKESELIASCASAVILGGLFAFFANNDALHALARRFGITKETSFSSEWFGAFLKNVTYVVLHLKDGRRIYGWPKEWPSEPTEGHFVLLQPSWLDGEVEIPITGVESILMRADDVRWVEFMQRTWQR